MPASAMTTEAHSSGALFILSSLFNADAGVVMEIGIQASGDPAADIGQDSGGRQVALGDRDRLGGVSRAGLHWQAI